MGMKRKTKKPSFSFGWGERRGEGGERVFLLREVVERNQILQQYHKSKEEGGGVKSELAKKKSPTRDNRDSIQHMKKNERREAVGGST